MADNRNRYFTAKAILAVTPEVTNVLDDLRTAQDSMSKGANEYLDTPVSKKKGAKTPNQLYAARKKATQFKFTSAKLSDFLARVNQAKEILVGDVLAEKYNTIFVTRDALETVANKYGLGTGYAHAYGGELSQEAVDALAAFDEGFDRADYRGEFLNQAAIDAALAHNEKYAEKKEVPIGEIKYRIMAPVTDFSGKRTFTPNTDTRPATKSPIIYTAVKGGYLIVTGWNPVEEDA